MALESQLDAGKPASFPLVEALRELSRDPHCCRQMVEAGVAALIPRIILDTANSLEMRVLAACLAGAVCSLPNACQAMRQPCVATSLWNLLLQLQACPSDCQRESLSGVAFALSALLRDAGASGGLQMQVEALTPARLGYSRMGRVASDIF